MQQDILLKLQPGDPVEVNSELGIHALGRIVKVGDRGYGAEVSLSAALPGHDGRRFVLPITRYFDGSQMSFPT
jgi:hypothetical protein